MGIVMIGTGSDLPARVVSNHDIERDSANWDAIRAGSSLDEWVMKRAGVSSRHRIGPGEGTGDMALRAVRRALEDAEVDTADVDLIVMTTFTSDARLPSSVSFLQRELGSTAKCIQLESACTGFIDALLVASGLMRASGYRTVVVVAAEAMSAVVDDQDFLYQSIFGDGAGAVVLREVPDEQGIEDLRSYTDATNCDWTWVPGGGTKHPIDEQVLRERSQYVSLAYREIYEFAVEKMVEVTREVLDSLGATIDEVDWLIPHQTGANIVGEVAEQLGLPREKLVLCLEQTGNVSGASVAIALDQARRAERFRDGDRIVVPVVGAGMAWGAVSLRWSSRTSVGA